MRRSVILLLILAGCSDMAGNDRGGLISNADVSAATFRQADQFCRQYGKKASIRQMIDTITTRGIAFDCI